MKHLGDFADIDYFHKLSDEEKRWFKKFLVEYYKGYFDTNGPNIHNKEQKREIKRDIKARLKDIYNKGKLDNGGRNGT